MNNNQKIIIFPIYFKKAPIFENEIFKPIQAGCADSEILNQDKILTDNTGDNISKKNSLYGELTATYWIWKNYLKCCSDIEYVGFCHYRRFFDFQKEIEEGECFEVIDFKIFENQFSEKNTKIEIEKIITGYDVILPASKRFIISNYNQFIARHPNLKNDFDKSFEIIKHDYPDYIPALDKVLSGNNLHICLNFVMKKDLFISWCEWIFDILSKLEKEIQFCDEKKRVLAFIAERLFDVWFYYQKDKNNLKVLERYTYILKDVKTIKFPFNTGKITMWENVVIINILGIKISFKTKMSEKISR